MERDTGQIEEILAAKKKPFYLLHGHDEFLVSEAAEKVTDRLLDGGDRSLCVEKFDCAEAAPETVVDALSTSSLFSDLRIVVLENAQEMTLAPSGEPSPRRKKEPREKHKNYALWERFRRLVESPLPDTHVVFAAAGEVKPR
ncbi:MAG: hypothetical protein AB1742_05065, partial [bacterium]